MTYIPLSIPKLLTALASQPNDLDLLNRLALAYFENYAAKEDREDYDYFERAYQLKKTVKSTHNFAWFLFFEWAEIEWRWEQNTAIERALAIQKECLSLVPKTYYPYYQMGYMYLYQKEYAAAIPPLLKAQMLHSDRAITHNLGCCYFQLGQYEAAMSYFEQASGSLDTEQRSQFNLALSAYQLQKSAVLQQLAEALKANLTEKLDQTISGYEVGQLFFLLEDYQTASTCLVQQGVHFIDVLEWPGLLYAYANCHPVACKELLWTHIDTYQSVIEAIETNQEDWANATETEKVEEKQVLLGKIKTLEEYLELGISKPKLALKKLLLIEYCGCLLFDCQRHGNPVNDDIF